MEKERKYQICTHCIMDTTDSKITFDENGVCDFCNDFEKNIKPNWKPMENNPALVEIANKIKKHKKGQKYDCLIGFSGGVDSSYLCYLAKSVMGLNPLALIVDTGWNLEIANKNIEVVLENLKIDSVKVTVDWNEMKDLQLSFLKSGVPYQDLPQDHAIFATIYNYAAKNRIRYVLTGANYATEYVRPPLEWVYQNDIVFIKSVHKTFGTTKKLKSFPFCGLVKMRFIYPVFKGIRRIALLNLVPYDKNNIKDFLEKKIGWQSYENKHYENRFTRWYEGYYLIKKFGYDKRRCYLSNLILTSEITRDEALAEISEEPYSMDLIQEDSKFIAEKLGISTNELEEYVNNKKRTFRDFKNSYKLINFGTKVLRFLKIEKKKYR